MKLSIILFILLALFSCSTAITNNELANGMRKPASEDERLSCVMLLSRLISKTSEPSIFLNDSGKFLNNIGDGLNILKSYSGEKKLVFLDQNADVSFIEKILGHNFDYDETLKVGDVLDGADGKRWIVESLDDYGKATLSNNDKAISWRTGIHRSYIYKFEIEEIGHSLTVTIPPLKSGKPDIKTLERIAKTIKELPVRASRELDEINVHARANEFDRYWGNKYGTKWLPKIINELTFRSAATGGGKKIALFPAGNSSIGMLELFRHELGHVLASSIYGRTMPDDIWKSAMKTDGRHVSSYAKKSISEDFAETVMEYFRVSGGVEDNGWLKPSYQKFEARFKILDKHFEVHLEEYRKGLDALRSARRIRLAGGGTVVAFTSGATYYIFLNED